MIKFLTLVQDVCGSAGEPIPSTIQTTSLKPQQRDVIKWLNFGASMLGKTYIWPWLQKDLILETIPEYTDGTVAVTEGSTTVTGTGTTWTPDMEGRLFKALNFEEPYRIERVASSTSLTLKHPFNNVDGTALGYTVFKDRYPLPDDFDEILNLFRFRPPTRFKIVTWEDFQRHRSIPAQAGALWPLVATISGQTEGKLVLEFGARFTDKSQIPVQYFGVVPKLNQDEDRWGFPPYASLALHDWALARVRADDQDDLQRGTYDAQQFFLERSEFSKLTPTQPRPRIVPESGERRIRAGRARRLHTVELGYAFDYDIVPWH